ncbi:MAG: AzlC family ABC transporter permease [Desulfitobacteriaceae bacterium]|nr:AzlC family ABC transporter permease [Desulfitobacteriaceae bacterium]MDD4346696.1 AzlC family ABC transporter permease [Desulfitobacteriaceae bacterium]MDD4401207.1 AzlC family ABC transporter permease [Desulfitobacteriaceae bacterium]
MENNRTWFAKGIRDGIPISLGYLAVSFTLGIAAKNAGLTSFQATWMSITNLTSAGQFAAFGLITLGVPYIEMAIAQLIINLRYCLMSCSLSQKLDSEAPFFHRLLVAYGVTDEIFGVSMHVAGKLNPFYTYGLICIAAPGWTMGTLLGVISGNILPTRILSALSVALYGMFIAIIIPPTRKDRVIAGLVVLSMMVSLLFTYLPFISEISAGFRIIILTVVIAGIAAVLFPIKGEDTKGEHYES